MADYIVTSTRTKPNGAGPITVVVRIDVPSGDNNVGVAWQTAVADYRALNGLTGTTLWPGGTATTLDSGAQHEFSIQHRDNIYATGVVTRIEADVTASAAAEQTRLSELLGYWGKTGTVT